MLMASTGAPIRFREESGHPLGLHRVVAPAGALPQPAWRLDNDPVPYRSELLIQVDTLNVDAASFAQIRGEVGNDDGAIARHVEGIVATRGKLHNPVTGSGGMLIGTVAAVGPDFPDRTLVPGDRIATLVSLSLTPLQIDRVIAVHQVRDQIEIAGQAILFASGLYARLPDDLDPRLALSVLDVAGAPAQVLRLVKPGDTAVVIGAGGKSGTLCLDAARRAGGQAGRVIAVVLTEAEQAQVLRMGLADRAVIADATDAVATLRAVEDATGGTLGDVVINCVNVAGTEMATILATRQGGTAYFFSMATSFTAAALGAEGVGKDINMIIGNGYTHGHADCALDAIRQSPALQDHFRRYYLNDGAAA